MSSVTVNKKVSTPVRFVHYRYIYERKNIEAIRKTEGKRLSPQIKKINTLCAAFDVRLPGWSQKNPL